MDPQLQKEGLEFRDGWLKEILPLMALEAKNGAVIQGNVGFVTHIKIFVEKHSVICHL